MSQLGRFDTTVQSATGDAISGASVTVYREGATVNGNQSGTTPLTVTVRHKGKIATADTVFINTTTGTSYTVNSTTATTVVLSGFVGTLALTSGDRIIPSNSQPTLYSDDQGGTTTSNPLTTSSTGRANCWMTPAVYDYIVSGSGVTTTLFSSQTVAVIYDDGTLYLRDGAQETITNQDLTFESLVTRDMSTLTTGQALLSGIIRSTYSNTSAFTNLSLNGLHVVNRHGVSGSGGGDVQTGIGVGAYSEHRGSSALTGSLYGAENSTTMYNTGSVVNAFGSLNTAQVTSGATATITTAEGVAGYARVIGTGAGTITTAIGVNGLAGFQDTASGTITDAIGGRFSTIKDGGVSGTITNAYGVNILNITHGTTNNYGIRIQGASGGSNINQSLRVDAGESHFIGPVTSPFVTFTDAATTPTVAGSNNFLASNTGATNITNFTNGKTGQRIAIVFTNGNTTIVNGATIINRTAANITPGANTTRSYILNGTVWYELS